MAKRAQASKMTRCRDCDGVISKRADHCPHCGCPRIPSYAWGVALAALLVTVLGTLIFIWNA